ncbi:coiled-coil domain-containing protein 167 isoform X1 [Tyto alba]|uniref:coiled-coil domain-containing protein 167 isoform X1 n=1 Tax=Tyto alba TaxID=56313 RepID=UPI001C686BF4|nr:coiled-coil domain-containing protein 167 isoform X1 [Tyto alba]
MGRRRQGLSVAREIDGLEEKLARCRQSMEEVDLKLRREKLSPEGRKSLERERNLLMTKADNYARGSDLSLKSCRPQQNECPQSCLPLILLGYKPTQILILQHSKGGYSCI